MLAHQYWRIKVLSSSDASTFQIAEFGMNVAVDGSNEVTSSFVSSTVDSVTYPITNICDGDASSYFGASAAVGDVTCNFDYGNEKQIVEYWVKAPASASKTPTSWEFQYSDDGASWTTLHTVKNVTFTAAEEKKFRLTQLSMRNESGSRFYSNNPINYAFFTQSTPDQFSAPIVVGTANVSDSLAVLETYLPVAGSAGFLIASDTSGSTIEQAHSFAAPIQP